MPKRRECTSLLNRNKSYQVVIKAMFMHYVLIHYRRHHVISRHIRIGFVINIYVWIYFMNNRRLWILVISCSGSWILELCHRLSEGLGISIQLGIQGCFPKIVLRASLPQLSSISGSEALAPLSCLFRACGVPDLGSSHTWCQQMSCKMTVGFACAWNNLFWYFFVLFCF